MNRHHRGFHLLWVVVFFWAMAAHASNLETLIMPGKVAQKHAKYEEKCEECHEAFSKKSQRRLCLKCHKEVAEDIRLEKRMHGRDKTIRTVECKQCHSDHHGRDADIVQFNTGLFDHGGTDFPLKGAHAGVSCGSCHAADKPYRKTPSDCYACHKDKDIHNGKLGQDCKACHAEESWQKIRFNHDKTDYPLTGKHKETACTLCHPDNRYKDIPDKCVDCHLINDVHAGQYGKKCEHCHGTANWRAMSFDHDKETKFPLRGKHKPARCDSCHKADLKEKIGMQCIDCHKKQDAHKGLYGQKCGDCHAEESWRQPTFDHKKFTAPCYDCHKNDDEHKGRYGQKCGDCHGTKKWGDAKFAHDKTKFPLFGKHKDIKCEACHKGDAKQERDKTACLDCHQADDVHKGKEGKQCQRCHNERGWREKISFDHDITTFPLIGMHATTSCEECHLNQAYKDTPTDCNSCHARKDVHKRGLGTRCESCHNPNSWAFWQFNHDTQTKFKLDGAHGGLSCIACHRSPMGNKVELATDCDSCHHAEDIHSGRFGRRCERCHNTRSFKEVSMPR